VRASRALKRSSPETTTAAREPVELQANFTHPAGFVLPEKRAIPKANGWRMLGRRSCRVHWRDE
jgi:hypothetical protein